jgi:transcriptional regulator with XRE-family HTH domain
MAGALYYLTTGGDCCRAVQIQEGKPVKQVNEKPVGRFGVYFRELRTRKRMGLREFCRAAEADPANVSRMESGLLPPPPEDTLRRYAEAIGVKYGASDWYTLVDLAAADRGIVPKDIMENSELAAKLPLFFRTLRGERPSEEDLRALAEDLKHNP